MTYREGYCNETSPQGLICDLKAGHEGQHSTAMMRAVERETVAAIVAGLRAKATASVRLLEQCDVNDANKTVHAAQSLAFYDAADWLESGAWKRGKERGDG